MLRIEITIPDDRTAHADIYLDEQMAALGFYRSLSGLGQQAPAQAVDTKPETAVAVPTGYTQEAPAEKRTPGQPSNGRTRRTKAEIAEDEAFVSAAVAASGTAVFSEPAAISSGEERISPEDAADEAAETAKTGIEPIDELRHVAGEYAALVGFATATQNIQKLLGAMDISELSDADIPDAIARIKDKIAEGAPEPTENVFADDPPPAKTLDDYKALIKAAFVDYAKAFDKTDDLQMAKFTQIDGMKVIKMVWPEHDYRISQLPFEPANLEKVLVGISRAIKDNFFKR